MQLFLLLTVLWHAFIAELVGHFGESHAVISLLPVTCRAHVTKFSKPTSGDSVCRMTVFVVKYVLI